MEYTFYKIQVGNECYVGSTNDFKNRMRQHKHSCHKEKDSNHKYEYKLYDYIRNNGGWEQCKCSWFAKVKTDKRNIIEANYIKLFNATLNTYSPVYDKKIYQKKYNKQYYSKNKEKLCEQNTVKGCCDICGKEMRKDSIRRHKLNCKIRT